MQDDALFEAHNAINSDLTPRNSSEKRLIPDPLKKDSFLAELWEVLNSKYFEPIKEKTFHILEKLYVSTIEEEDQGCEIDPNDPDKLLRFFNSFMNQKASEVALGRSVSKLKAQDNEFLHFAVCCKYYLPLLSANPKVRYSDEGG